MYALNGSKGACLRFQRSASVTLFSMKTEYCLRNVDTNWVKLSIEFSSSPANHSRAAPVRFSAKKRQYPASFSSSVRCAFDIARRKARTSPSDLCSWRIRGISVSQRDAVFAGDSICEWGPSRFVDDHVDIESRARRHMYDRIYSFELGVVPFDIILEGSSFVRDSQVFPLGVDIDGTAKIVSPSLLCWVIEHCLIEGPGHRRSSILGDIMVWW